MSRRTAAEAIRDKDLSVSVTVKNVLRTTVKRPSHSWRWCETCRLFTEWLRFAKNEPDDLFDQSPWPEGLSRFLWDRFAAHRRTGL